MRMVWHLTRVEWRRMMRAKETFWLQFFMPLVILLILGNALSGIFAREDIALQPIPTGAVILDSADDGLAGILSDDGMAALLSVREYGDEAALLAALQQGEVDYGVLVPADFTASVIAGEPAGWQLYPGKNREQNLVAGRVVETVLEQINFHQAAAMAMADIPAAAGFGPEWEMPALDYGDNRSLTDSVDLQIVFPDRSGRDYSAMEYYSAHMLVMFLLYAGMGTGLSIVAEKQEHTMSRLYAAPVRPVQVLSGKMLGNMLVMFGQSASYLFFTWLLYGVKWGAQPLALVLTIVLIALASVSLAVLVTAFISTSRGVSMVFSALIVAMTFLSGGYMPDIGDFLATLGRFTLNHWASQSFLHVILNSESEQILTALTVLGMITAVLFLMSALLGRKAVSHE